MFVFDQLLACEYNVHKGSCFETIEECPGTKKKRERVSEADKMFSLVYCSQKIC